jgi:hypothetical protein
MRMTATDQRRRNVCGGRNRRCCPSNIHAVSGKRSGRVYFSVRGRSLVLLWLRADVLPSAQKIAKNTGTMHHFTVRALRMRLASVLRERQEDSPWGEHPR